MLAGTIQNKHQMFELHGRNSSVFSDYPVSGQYLTLLVPQTFRPGFFQYPTDTMQTLLVRARYSALILFVFSMFATGLSAQKLDMEKFEAMKARSIGPAGMSGRVTSIDVVSSDMDVIYAGTASGGLWKSMSGGVEWKSIFDDQKAHSIGAVAVNQSNPDIIWVGTGEGNPRNSQSSGNGVYKSIDGGSSWTHLGLDDSRNIHRIILNPDDPDVAYIGVQGPAWGETETRGVYRTQDGGVTFERVLFNNVRTGIGDMVVDPSNPDHLIAAMWEFRRWPWFFKSGGEGSGMYVTWDGGDTWTRKTDKEGLPKGELGRMGLAFSVNEPEIVYALIESKKNALYKSTDGGRKWKKINDKDGVVGRPFYYADLYVDPENENRLYNVGSTIRVSEDGGANFRSWQPSYSSKGIHPDHHALWVSSLDPDFIIDGNDGGMSISRDKGKTWRFVENLPVAQFYHINVDNEFPYNVMGGMQDNGSWIGPAYVLRAGGIRNSYWQEIAFGDGFDVLPDPEDSRYGYAMSQGGSVSRYDKETGESSRIKPYHPDGEFLRFNWNSGIAQDPFRPGTIYFGSQYLHRSDDRGQSWAIISPDLTTNDPEKQKSLQSGGLTYDATQAENFTTIVSIAPSPVTDGVIWVGTDDGNLQLTRDGGKNWENVIGNVSGVPEGTWIPQIRASTYDAAAAFVVFDDHRRNNWEPYVYRTGDFGRSWERMVTSDDVWGFALSVLQDAVEPNLIFIGTEFGLYVSIDDGKNFTKWTPGYPTASTIDMVIQPREQDLVIGTFGRSAYVLDDIRPLRELASEGAGVLDEAVHVYPAPDAYRASNIQAAGTRFWGSAIYAGENRQRGAMITYSINPELLKPDSKKGDDDDVDGEDEEHTRPAVSRRSGGGRFAGASAEGSGNKSGRKATIEIVDSDGNVIRTLKGPAEEGMNRFYWNMTRKGYRFPSRTKPRKDSPEPGGARVLPGTYTVRVSIEDFSDSTQVTVAMDPRYDVDLSALKARDALDAKYEKVVTAAREMMDRVRESGEAVARVQSQLKALDDSSLKDLRKQGKAMKDSLDAYSKRFFGRKKYQGILGQPNTVQSKMGAARGYIYSSLRPPGTSEEASLRVAEREVKVMLEDVNAFFAGPWNEYREAVQKATIKLVPSIDAVSIE
jgi:photosystem II stability/assembly factor-like uncharacterized protein